MRKALWEKGWGAESVRVDRKGKTTVHMDGPWLVKDGVYVTGRSAN